MKQNTPSNRPLGGAIAGDTTSEFGNPVNLSRSLDALRNRVEQLNENLHRAISIARPLLTVDPRDLPTSTREQPEKSPPSSPHTYEIQAITAKLDSMNDLLHQFGSHLDT